MLMKERSTLAAARKHVSVSDSQLLVAYRNFIATDLNGMA